MGVWKNLPNNELKDSIHYTQRSSVIKLIQLPVAMNYQIEIWIRNTYLDMYN